MSEILKEQQWQRRRAAKLQRANRPRVGLLLLASQQPRPRQNFQNKSQRRTLRPEQSRAPLPPQSPRRRPLELLATKQRVFHSLIEKNRARRPKTTSQNRSATFYLPFHASGLRWKRR